MRTKIQEGYNGKWENSEATLPVVLLSKEPAFAINKCPELAFRCDAFRCLQLTLFIFAAVAQLSAHGGDWVDFRGPKRDGVVHGEKIGVDWKSSPPRELWRRRVGSGCGSMIVVNDVLVTQEQRGEFECVVCYDALTGVEEWAHRELTRFEATPFRDAGPRATPSFNNGRIVAMGASGKLVCLVAADGALKWSHDLTKETNASIPYYGFTASPLIKYGLVIAYGGGDVNRALLAYHLEDGTQVWSRGGQAISYSSPQPVTFDGKPQILMHDNRGLTCVRLNDGSLEWSRAVASRYEPRLQPHLIGNDRILVAGNPRSLIYVDLERRGGAWVTRDARESAILIPGDSNFVVQCDYIYALSNSILCCFDLKTGAPKWSGGKPEIQPKIGPVLKEGVYWRGKLLLLADQEVLLILDETGDVSIVEATPKAWRELGKVKALEGTRQSRSHTVVSDPVVAHGRLYVRNTEEMVCFELPKP